MVNRFISLFGEDVIESIVADREFVGDSWLGFLNRNGIKYYIRIRNNFKIELPHKHNTIKAWHLFNAYEVNEFVFYPNIVRINGQLRDLSGSKLGKRNGKTGFSDHRIIQYTGYSLGTLQTNMANRNVL